MEDLYREQIIDRYKNPHMKGSLDPHDHAYEDDNPLCGDRIRIELRVDGDDRVTEAVFSGVGCAISIASADLLVESIIGQKLEEIRKLGKQDVLDMLGIEVGPIRLKCALLSLKVLKASIYGLESIENEIRLE